MGRKKREFLSKKLDPEETRQTILQSALEAFAQRGYSQTTMDEIAAKAGVSKGALYWHFKDKKTLFLAVCEERASALEKAMRSALEEPGTTLDKIARLLISTLRFCAKNRPFAVILGFLRVRQDPAVGLQAGEPLRTWYSEARSILSQVVQKGIETGEIREVDPSLTASLIIGTVDGLVFQWLMDPEGCPLTPKVTEEVAELILRGLQKRDRSPKAPLKSGYGGLEG